MTKNTNGAATFAATINAARVRRKLDIVALATAANLSAQYVAGIEGGSIMPPSPRVVKSLCKILRLSYRKMLALAWWEKRPVDLDVCTAFVLIQERWQEHCNRPRKAKAITSEVGP